MRAGSGRVHEGDHAGDGATRAKAKASAEKRAGEQKSAKLQAGGGAGVQVAADAADAQLSATTNEIGTTALVVTASEGTKPAPEIVSATASAGDSKQDGTQKAPAGPVGVSATAAAVLPALGEAVTTKDAAANVPTWPAGVRPLVQAETAKATALPAPQTAAMPVSLGNVVQASTGVLHARGKESAPVAGAKFDAEPW